MRSVLLASLFLFSTIAISQPAAAECIQLNNDNGACVDDGSWDSDGDGIHDCNHLASGSVNPGNLDVRGETYICGDDSSSEWCGGLEVDGSFSGDCIPLDGVPNPSVVPGMVGNLCDPGRPCVSLDPIGTSFPVAAAQSGDVVVATIGAGAVTLTTGQTVTILLVASGDNPPCSTVTGLPGVASCIANPIIPEQKVKEVEQGGAVACLRESRLSVDINGDGIEDGGTPVFSPAVLSACDP